MFKDNILNDNTVMKETETDSWPWAGKWTGDGTNLDIFPLLFQQPLVVTFLKWSSLSSLKASLPLAYFFFFKRKKFCRNSKSQISFTNFNEISLQIILMNFMSGTNQFVAVMIEHCYNIKKNILFLQKKTVSCGCYNHVQQYNKNVNNFAEKPVNYTA